MRVLKIPALFLTGALLLSCDGRTAADRAVEDGMLILGNSSEPKGLDPHLVAGVLESNLIRAITEGLCNDHPEKDGIALPGAAERWEHNEDFTIWTFHLRPDGVWSDGVPVTAHDFLFSYERILTQSLGSEYSEMLFYIEGAEDFYKGGTEDFGTVGVKAIDDHTLEVTLRGSIPFLPEITKHYTWYPVPRHVVLEHSGGKIDVPFSGWTKPENFVGNGPFTLKSWKINDHIEVVKNPLYWDAGRVELNGIRFLPVTNSYTEARMFYDGLLHVTYTLPPELIPYSNERYPEEVRSELYLGTRFIRCNITRPPLDNPEVRRALALTIDRASLIDNVLQGGQMPAYGMVPPFGDYETRRAVEFDPEEGKRLLAEAGYGNPGDFPRIRLLTADRDVSKRMAEAYQGMWKQHLGIDIDIEQKEWTSYLNAMTRLEYDLADGGWIGDYLDPTTFLDMWITGGGNNRTGWSNEEFETLLKKSEHERDPLARLDILQAAESILMGDTPILPVYWYTTNYLIDSRVKGWHPMLLNHHPYKFLSLEPNPD
jgi:oligopeptide transport system substrate-binding protein